MSAIDLARAEIAEEPDGSADLAGPVLLETSIVSPSSDAGSNTDLAALAKRYLELRQGLAKSARGRVAALRLLSVYRRAHEELQNSFFALERRMPPEGRGRALAFASEANGESAVMGWGNTGLSQVLPIASEGLGGITIQLARLPQAPGAILHAHLVGLEDHSVIDSWTMPVERLAGGPVTLALSRHIVGATRTLDLMLELEGPDPDSVSICLGDRQPLRQFQARRTSTGNPGWPNMIAMQLWCGGEDRAAAVTVEADPRPSETDSLLSPTLLCEAAHANGHEVRFDFKPVSFVAHRIAVACHPPSHGMTIAEVPLPRSAPVLGVSAEVEVGNAKGKAVRFSCAIASDLNRAQRLFEGEPPEAGEACSGWTAATFAEPSRLAATASEAAPQSKLYLATTMAIPGENSFAWARFRALRISTGRPGHDNSGSR